MIVLVIVTMLMVMAVIVSMRRRPLSGSNGASIDVTLAPRPATISSST